ncbi:MAG: hypothetical protein ACRDT6_14020 [Micromonosporaceae bacterium]
MAWFRRKNEPKQAPPPPPDTDSPAVLRKHMTDLDRYVNRNAGRLPGEAVVASRLITDKLREAVDTSDNRPLDVYALVSIKGILTDYLPTTLRHYLALDPSVVHTPRPSGHTPIDSLRQQLDWLRDSASGILVAARAHDADALLTQGNFLQTKFSGSDLDL